MPRYFALYKRGKEIKHQGIIFICLIALNALIYIVGILTGIDIYDAWVVSYANPLVIGAALFLVLIFSKIKMQVNMIINFVSRSAFAVYLFHCQEIVFSYYRDIVNWFYKHYSGVEYLLAIFIFLVIVFAFSILLDQPRKWLWNMVWRRVENKQLFRWDTMR